MSVERDRVTVRKALRAGVVVAVAVTAVLGTFAASVGGGVFASLLAGIGLGAFVMAGWLLLAAVLDILAGESPGTKRTVLTIGVTVVALLSPFLVLTALLSR